MAVEDSPLQAHSLRMLLLLLGYDVLGIVSTAEEAELRFREQTPDLVLLDICLPGPVDGVELAMRLTRIRPVPLIFLTSLQDNATFERARAVGPFAFLTKPYQRDVLNHAMELAVQHFAVQHGAAPAATAADGLLVRDSLFLRNGSRLDRIHLRDLLWIEADSSYCHLHTAARKYTLHGSLRALEERLPADQFVRVHRGYIVAIAGITSLDPTANRIQVHEQWLPLGPTFRDELLRRLPLFS